MPRFAPYDPAAPRRTAPFDLRPATPDDAGGIARLEGHRLEQDPASIVEPIRASLAALDRQRVIVALNEGTVAAFGRLRWIAPGPAYRNVPEGWYLNGVVVDPARRRCGIGQALVAARLALAAEAGAAEVFYTTNAQNLASLALHERFGFSEVTRDFDLPGATSAGAVTVLLRAPLGRRATVNAARSAGR